MITACDEVTDAVSEFEALRPFATEVELKHMDAILLYGSAKAGEVQSTKSVILPKPHGLLR